MPDARAKVTRPRRVSPIWIVPILALLLGIWMLVYAYRNQGPSIEIVFPTAMGIEAGRTKVKVRDVEVGKVESLRLGADLKSVVVRAQLDADARPLLREDTEFWIVSARLGSSGVSGITTLLSGVYIQLQPGQDPRRRGSFVGLVEPPVTPTGTPGLKFELVGEAAGAVSAGDPILFEGYPVGRIESATLDVQTEKMRYEGFIEEDFQELVTSATRFWNSSGLSFSATANGIDVQAGSLTSILIGGVSFGLPEGVGPGEPVRNGIRFELHPDYKSVNRQPYGVDLEYVVRFGQSVRGLFPGAPVEYRGINVGRVERILIEEVSMSLGGNGAPIPVLIRLQPGRLMLPDTQVGAESMKAAIENSVGIGMRASLATGNLLTGSRYVSLDIHPRELREELGLFAGRMTIPTLPSGLEGLESQVSELLDKLNDLPLGDLAQSATRAVDGVDELLRSESLRELPASLSETLAGLRDVLDDVSADSALQERLLLALNEFGLTLESFRALMVTLNEQPNSIVFPREPAADPIPPSGQ